MSSRYFKDHSSSSSRRGRKKDEEMRKRQGNKNSRSDDHSTSSSPKLPDDTKSLSKQIPGYSDMTPAERVRAKMKLLLDKTSSQSDNASSLINIPVPPPDQMEICSIESDSFAPQSFVSSRKKRINEPSDVTSTHEDVIFGKTDSLQAKFPFQGSGGSSLTSVPVQYQLENNEIVSAETSDEDLALKWIRRLVELRKRYSSPPMD